MHDISKLLRHNKLIRDIFNEKIGVISLKVFSFILTIILSRTLGPKGYGIYTVAISLAFIISSFLDLGVPIAIIRYLPRETDEKEREKVLGYLLRIQLIFNIVFAVILVLFSSKFAIYFFKSPKYTFFALISLALAVVISFKNSFSSIVVSYKRFDIVRNINFLEGGFKVIFIILLTLFFGVYGAVLGFFIAFLLLVVTILYYLKRDLGVSLKIFEDVKNKLEILRNLVFYNINTLSRMAYGFIDALIISALLDFYSVGYYRIANALVSSVLMFSGLQLVFSPRISKWDIRTIKRNLPKIILLNLAISIPIFLLLNYFGKFLIIILYGKAYIKAYDLLRVLSFLVLLNSLSYFNWIFDIKGRPEFTAASVLIMAISNAILDYILITKMGLIGAVWATVISWMISLAFSGIIFKLKF